MTFLETLALCHTVQVSSASTPSAFLSSTPDEEKGGPSEVTAGLIEMEDLTPVYHASSPDEKALVEACARLECPPLTVTTMATIVKRTSKLIIN